MIYDDWEVKKIREIGEVLSGGTPSTKKEEYFGGNIPWITPKDLSGYSNRYIFQGNRNITQEGLDNSSAKLLPKGSILFSSRAPIGYVAIAGCELTTNQGFKNIVCNPKFANNIFMYYKMKTLKEEFELVAGGSTFKEVSAEIVKEFEILLPPLEEQEKIAELLTAIDKKIELNIEINKSLEEMAQAFFKHWFIDFEFPNENDEPYKSSGGKFVESELGMIPKGWEVSTIGDFVTIKHGYAFKSKDFSEDPTNLIILSPGNFKIGGGFKDDKFKYLQNGVNFPQEYVLEEIDLLVTMTDLSRDGDTLGYPAFVPQVENAYYLHNQRLGKILIKEKNYISKFFLYNLFCTHRYRGYILGTATGTTVKHTAPKRIAKFNFVLPKTNLLRKFDEIIVPIYKYISELNKQSSNLKGIRDTLLPKLMSGEIRIPEAEQEVEECLQKTN